MPIHFKQEKPITQNYTYEFHSFSPFCLVSVPLFLDVQHAVAKVDNVARGVTLIPSPKNIWIYTQVWGLGMILMSGRRFWNRQWRMKRLERLTTEQEDELRFRPRPFKEIRPIAGN